MHAGAPAAAPMCAGRVCGRVAHQAGMRAPTRAAVRTAAAVSSKGSPITARIPAVSRFDEEQYVKELEMEMGMCQLRRYSPEGVQDAVIKNPSDVLTVVARGYEMISSIVGYAGALWLDSLRGEEYSDTPEVVKKRSVQLREMLVALGPTFIKAGQVLANRPDILRADYMNELCVLQDDVPPFPDEVAYRIIEDQLGRPMGEVFSSISERPVAAASLGQVYKARLRETGEVVAIKVQRPNVGPDILRDLVIFRWMAKFVNSWAISRLGCNAELIVDEFGQKLIEELDYELEAANIMEFGNNFAGDETVKIPWVRRDLCGPRMLVMEWIDGIRCTDPDGIRRSGIDVARFIKVGVVSGLRQLLEFGLFHGDPHPGNIFAMRDGRIAYVDFGNVAQLSQSNKQVLIDAVVHAVNEDYEGMAVDFIKLGFLAPGTDTRPLTPALEKIWKDSMGQSLEDFNFRTVTGKFNELVYQYPIRIPERYSLVIRSLLTQEGICMTLDPKFHFLEVAYPYVARRLLTDEDPALRERLLEVLFQNGRFQWHRLENLVTLAREGGPGGGGIDLSDTARDAASLVLTDGRLRAQVLGALTEDNRLHVDEVMRILDLVREDIDPQRLLQDTVQDLPRLSRRLALAWSDSVLSR
ncbi:unnamed protein product [Pedinophyceae sp. YPF-701]|nr:unnamed protein product [Pedinophyceae sp. YPF-701]